MRRLGCKALWTAIPSLSIRMFAFYCAIVAIIVPLVNPAAAAPVVDQKQESATYISFNMHSSGLEWQQEVTAGVSGTLVGIEFFAHTTGSADFYVNLGAPWQTDADDYAATVTSGVTSDWVYVDVFVGGYQSRFE